MEKQKAYIFDIDGTIADSEMRHLYKENIARGDWSWFTRQIPNFKTIESTVAILNALRKNYRIIFVTVRSDADRIKTLRWLKKHELYDGELHMRPDTSRSLKDYQEKEILLKKLLERYDIIGAIDDNAECLEMFRRHGIPTLHFAKG
jgi:FMN phosphatase YigB (HAD superfamily)